MGTRSLTIIKDGDKLSGDVCVIYRQMDGYPDGQGKDIKRLIGRKVVVNGYGDDTTVANGMGCLAAQLVTGLKLDVLKQQRKYKKWADKCFPKLQKKKKVGMAGGIYLHPAGTRDLWEDYTYTIYLVKKESKGEGEDSEDEGDAGVGVGELHMMVQSHGKTLYDGLLRKFSPEACKYDEE